VELPSSDPARPQVARRRHQVGMRSRRHSPSVPSAQARAQGE
jgi:hypothetical protein